MTWGHGGSSSMWLSSAVVLFLLILSIYGPRQRTVSGVLPLAVDCLPAALWSTGALVHQSAAAQASKIRWINFHADGAGSTLTKLDPLVIAFHMSDSEPGIDVTQLRERSNPLLIGADPSSDELLVLSSHSPDAFSVAGLLGLTDQIRTTARALREATE